MTGKHIPLLAGACVVGLLVSAARADLSMVPGGSYVYDFEACGSAGAISGKDNWTSNGIDVQTAPSGGAPHPGSGLCATTWGGTATYTADRLNDASWSYDLSGQPQFSFGFSFSTDYGVSGYYGDGYVMIRNSVTAKQIRLGIEILPWYYAVTLTRAQGGDANGGQPRPTARNQKWYIKADIDTTAFGGEGSGSVYTWRPGTHATWQPVTNLQNIQLNLATAGMDIANSDTLKLRIKTRLLAIDDIWITPEPATAALLALGGIGLLIRRRRR